MAAFVEASAEFFSVGNGQHARFNTLDATIKAFRFLSKMTVSIRDYWGFKTW